MIRSLVLVTGVIVACMPASYAQTATGRSAANPRDGALNVHNITRTGATVPNPGMSQGAGSTPLDLGAQRRDNEIQNSICRGC